MLKAKKAVPTLRTYYGGVLNDSLVGNASGWAIQQITGEPLAQPIPIPENQRGWFLEPITEPASP